MGLRRNVQGHPEPPWLAERAYQHGWRRGFTLGCLLGLAVAVTTAVVTYHAALSR